jgi:hypothetical protein
MQSEVALSDAASPVPPGTTRADFYTGCYRITADVNTGDRRLLEVLRDSTRHYLEVRRVGVSSPDAPECAPISSADGLLDKAGVDWIAVRAEPSRAAGKLYGYVKKTPVRVRLVLPMHCIEGNVFVENSATDPMTVFLRGIEKSTERFLAVGSATITSASGAADSAVLAIVNRTAVSLFSVVR